MSRLTPRQREALAVMADCGHYSPARLANALDTSKEGAAMTASSLVRKGHAERVASRPGGRLVNYRITAQGLAQVEHAQTAFT